MNWYLKVIKQYADFNGRARRKEYWMFFLFNIIVAAILGTLAAISLAAESNTIATILYVIYSLYGLAVLIPGLAVTVRRLHDLGKSGAFIFVAFIPIIGGIWLLVLTLTEGTNGENQYGPNPKDETISTDII